LTRPHAFLQTDSMSGARQAPEITAAELLRRLESGEPIQVLDVRTPAALANGVIDHLLPPQRFWNVPGSQIIGRRSFGEDFVRQDSPVAVVCYHGNDSRFVAYYLNRLGYDAASLSGGMTAWMRAVAARELAPPAGFDRLIQFDRVGKGALGYLLASGSEALLVDPPRDATVHLEAVERAGARLVGIADTHVHADYVSGAPSLSLSRGVPYYLHPADAVSPYDGRRGELEIKPVQEGSTIRVGRGEIRVEHSPGHTEGSVAYRIGDDAALTGDFLFIRSVGRPDLGGKTDAWIPLLWKSLERARREWPEGLRVFPGHYADAGEREPDRSIGRRFADLAKDNEPLRMRSAGEFSRWVKAHAGAFPEAYRIIKRVNLGLELASPEEMDELEGGKNACALG
jgi:glyoxylase-like metal-dependent hydrolase (beta-lactamase superfamily II)